MAELFMCLGRKYCLENLKCYLNISQQLSRFTRRLHYLRPVFPIIYATNGDNP